MSARDTGNITKLLQNWGDERALEELCRAVEGELRGIAFKQLAAERKGHSLRPSDLVNEAYVRLLGQQDVRWADRIHFFAIAARMMRRVLIDHARKHNAERRGAGIEPVRLDAGVDVATRRDPELDRLMDALDGLEKIDPTLARIAELKFFVGFKTGEIADTLDIAPVTVKKKWSRAKEHLKQELGDG